MPAVRRRCLESEAGRKERRHTPFPFILTPNRIDHKTCSRASTVSNIGCMIPRVLHQIWLGPRRMPETWMRTWRDAHRSWTYRIWREKDLDGLGLENQALFLRCHEEELFDAAADVARAEILLRLGGVYVDADSVCLRSFDRAPFLDAGFFATLEPTPLAEDLISNAFMGARPWHPVLQRYLKAISSVVDPRPQWRQTGPLQLTAAVRAGDERDVRILPAWTFLTQTLRGEPVTGGHPYGEHHFSSSAARNPSFPGAQRYPP